jgi:hypothetical protein
VTAAQLHRRAEPAWVAAVGLDAAKRQRAQEYLADRLGAADVSERQRLDLASAALTLGDLDPAFYRRELEFLVEGLASKDDPVNHTEVARRLVESTQAMGPGAAADVLTRMLEKEPDAAARRVLAVELAAVAGRVEPAAAARVCGQAADVLTRALEKETNAGVVYTLVEGLEAAAGQLEPAEAARAYVRAAGIMGRALEKETTAKGRLTLARALSTVAGKLDKAEATSVCQAAVRSLLRAAETERAEAERLLLVAGVALLLPALDDPEAGHISRGLAFAVCSGRNADFRDRYSEWADFFDTTYSWVGGETSALDVLLTGASRSATSRRTPAAAAVVGLVSASPILALPVLPAVSEPLPCRLSTEDLVELLKMPTCRGGARRIVLNHLGNRYGRTFANHWEFVHYAEEHHLGLDFVTPPKRPGRLRS